MKIYRLFINLLLLFILWVLLTGQLSEPIDDPNTTKGSSSDISGFFQSFKSASQQKTPIWIYVAAVLVIIGGTSGIIVFQMYTKHLAQMRIRRVANEQASVHFEMFLKNKKLSDVDLKQLEKLTGSKNPSDLYLLSQDPEKFEEKVTQLKADPHVSIDTKQLYKLRHRLGFYFLNTHVPFVVTQMLTPGLKLECQIPHDEKKILFVSPVLRVTENEIMLRPPTIKKKPVNLKRFPHLICRIRRQNIDFEFNLPILNQISEKYHVVIVKHTNTIKKLFVRNYERVELNLVSQIEYVTPENYEAVKGQLNQLVGVGFFEGTIVDLSLGGLKIEVLDIPREIQQGHILLFHLDEAKIRQKLPAKLLRIRQLEQGCSLHLSFIQMRELERMKLRKFILKLQES